MQQIISITDARNNLSKLVQQVIANLQPVIIVRDSQPEVAIVPYAKILADQQKDDQLWKTEWDKFIKEARKAGKRWAKKNKISLKTIPEEELYDLIDKI